MTVTDILTKFEALGSEKLRAQNKRHGALDNQYGVKMGDIRNMAKPIKVNHELAKGLWATGNMEARLLAILIMDVKKLTAEEVDAMVRSERGLQVADWLNNYIVKEHPDKEQLRLQWMQDADPMEARSGWSLTAGRIARNPEGLDIPALLDRIEREMPTVAAETQWTMNTALAQTGINHPEYRQRALEIGERLGIYRDYPTPKGCTSPFAPIWINEMVKRKG